MKSLYYEYIFRFSAIHRYVLVNWFPHGHVYTVYVKTDDADISHVNSIIDKYDNSFLMDVYDPIYKYIKQHEILKDCSFIEFEPTTRDEIQYPGECALRRRLCERLYNDIHEVCKVSELTLIKSPAVELTGDWKKHQTFLIRLSHILSNEDNNMWTPDLCVHSFDRLIDICPSLHRDIRDTKGSDILTVRGQPGSLEVLYDYDAGDNYEAMV